MNTSSEHARPLVSKGQDRRQLRQLLLAGAASSIVGEADAAYFDGLRERVRVHRCALHTHRSMRNLLRPE